MKEVVAAAVRNALDGLPPRAFGLRSHALPTEDNLDECIEAVEDVLSERGLGNTQVVVGSSRTPKRTPKSSIIVLPSDAAAAEATRIRNTQAPTPGPHLLYFNSDSTPGEAGLAGLTELTSAEIAAAFAEQNNLADLKELARSSARAVRARIEDAGPKDLARYAEVAADHSEQYAAPLLGFLPARQGIPTVRARRAFDTLTGPRAVQAFKDAGKALRAVSADDRAVLESALSNVLLPSTNDPLETTQKLCEAATRYAQGYEVAPDSLCGMTIELSRALRSGNSIVDRLKGVDSEEQPSGTDVSVDGLMTDAEFLDSYGREALAGAVSAEDAEEDSDASVPRMVVPFDNGDVTIRPNGRAVLLRAALERFGRESWSEGFAIMAPDGAQLSGEGLGRIVAKDLRDIRKIVSARQHATPKIHAAMGQFLTSRSGLLDAAASVGLHSDVSFHDAPLKRGLGLIEHAPLLIAAKLPTQLARYVDAYSSLLAEVVAEETPSVKVLEWLTNIDLAFVTDGTRLVRQACLLPLHPLRLAYARMWLEQMSEPPPLPATLGVYWSTAQSLVAEGRDFAFTRIDLGSPAGDAGLAAAGRDGLRALWALLRTRELGGALAIELVDVPSPTVVADTLCLEAERLLEDDADVDGIHIDLAFAYSDAQHEREIRVADPANLCSESRAALTAVRGSGVSLSMGPETVRAGQEPRHLVIQSVEAPFVKLPDQTMAAAVADAELVYRPGSNGNVALVEIRNFPPLERYNDLLRKEELAPDLRGREPTLDYGLDGEWLVSSSVSRRGWPVAPSEVRALLSHQEVDEHVVVTLLRPKLFDALIPKAMARVSAGAEASEVQRLVEGTIAIGSCRAFFRKILDEEGDDRERRGALGVLRAFAQARSSPVLPQLVLSFDGTEGRRWVRTVARAAEVDEQRADLLFVEADESLSSLNRLRVVELKARDTKVLSDKRLKELAWQAQLTASRLRRSFARSGYRDATTDVREALRRFWWFGAGTQRLALKWRTILAELDGAISGSVPPQIDVECWIVPEEEWSGPSRLTLQLQMLSAEGTVTDETESVTFCILSPTPGPREPSPPVPPSSTRRTRTTAGSPGETTSTRTAVPASPSPLPVSAPSAQPPSQSNDLTAPEVERSGSDGILVRVGTLERGEPALWIPNRTDLVNHFNIGITGTMGTGKTQLTKSLVAQLLFGSLHNVGGRRPGVLIFDYKGDYSDTPREPFATAIGARVLAPEGLPINPLHASRPRTRQEFTLMPQAFADTLRTIDARIGAVQRNEIIRAVKQCYAAAGISDSDPTTWNRPFPTLRKLYDYMVEEQLAEGTPQSIVHDIADLGVFADEDPKDDLDAMFDGVHVINLKPLGSTPTVIRAIIAFFINAFYDRMLQLGEAEFEERGGNNLRQLRRLVLVDEADDFIGLNLISLKNVMQQGRSFGHGVILSTQFLHHFNKTDTPLRSLVGTWILHQMSDLGNSDVKALFGMSSNAEASQLVHRITSLPQHTSLCLGLSNTGARNKLTLVRDLPYKDLPKPAGG